MNSARPSPTPEWVRSLPGGSRAGDLRLFYFPYAGAGASVFRNWGAGLPPSVEAFAIQLPGREDRFFDRPFTDLDELLDALAPALRPYLDRPFAFFGHSMGAIICWELSRRLRREEGLEPTRVFVSGCRALHLHETRFLGPDDLSDAALVDELRRLNGTPEELLRSPDFLSFILPAYRADASLFLEYVYHEGEPLGCPVSAFGGAHDPRVSEEQVWGWAKLTSGPCDVQIFPGGHLFIHNAAEDVKQRIAEALIP